MARPSSESTRDQIRSAALDAFWAKGYHATTTREIASAIGLSPAAVYVHFQSKAQLLAEIICDSHTGLVTEIDGAVEESSTPPERLAEIIKRFSAFNAARQRIAIVAERELNQLEEDPFSIVRSQRDHVVDVLENTLAEGVAAGDFEIEPSEIHDLVFGMIAISKDLARWYRPDGPLSPEQLGARHGNWALRLVCSKSGAESTPPYSSPATTKTEANSS